MEARKTTYQTTVYRHGKLLFSLVCPQLLVLLKIFEQVWWMALQ